jgi:[ribosomal protein S5]-alanine N-acetyltransferase
VRLCATDAWRDDVIELFQLLPEHASASYVGWLNDPAMNRHLESRFLTHDVRSVAEFIESCLHKPDVVFFGVRLRGDSRHVGNIKLEINRPHRRAEVGILIGDPGIQGRGVGTRAIRRVIEIARHELKLRRLTAGCYASNKGSERAFVKAGFQIEASRPGYFLSEGREEALTLMGYSL